jgi:K+ transporter
MGVVFGDIGTSALYTLKEAVKASSSNAGLFNAL